MPRPPGSKNKHKSNEPDYHINKLKELGYNTDNLTKNDGEPASPPVEPEPLNITQPETVVDEQEYICGECGGKVNKGVSACPSCGEVLSWKGIE